MQLKSIRFVSYRVSKIDDRDYSPLVLDRLEKLKLYEELIKGGLTQPLALKAIGWSRATYYRYRRRYLEEKGLTGLENKSRCPKHLRRPQYSRQLEQLVYRLRRQQPMAGKTTLVTLINRDHGYQTSESTVGRILSKGIKLGKFKPVAFYHGRVKAKKKRVFNKHAKRWKRALKCHVPGEMIQIDHMSVQAGPGCAIKHFQAICPMTKVTIAQAYSSAGSQAAKDFLDFVKQELPFPIKSIQVDGGSEFMKHFETSCEKSDIELYVLPPRSPELNGCVERCNRTLRYEFYGFYDGELILKSVRESLQGYMKLYNEHRPHQSLNQQTPMAYYQQYVQEAL